MLTQQAYEAAVAAAVRAPSLHNTQPWLFHRDGDRIELRADPTRWLQREDPLKRELHLSCGGALRHLVLGLRAGGLDAEVETLPDPAEWDLLARVTCRAGRPMTPLESALSRAVWTRHTDRSRFAPEPVADGVTEELRSVVEAQGCHLDVLGAQDRIVLAVLSAHAEEALESDPHLANEQAQWTSTEPEPLEGVPRTPAELRGSDLALRRFGTTGLLPPPTSGPPPAERPVVCVLSTDDDGRASWLACGWALSDLLLLVEARGLAASPLTQVLELPGLRAQVRGALGLQGQPQMVLRLGVPSGERGAVTGRRPVGDVVR